MSKYWSADDLYMIKKAKPFFNETTIINFKFSSFEISKKITFNKDEFKKPLKKTQCLSIISKEPVKIETKKSSCKKTCFIGTIMNYEITRSIKMAYFQSSDENLNFL